MNEQELYNRYEDDIAAGRLLRLPCIIGDEITYIKNETQRAGICQDISWRGDRFTYGTQFVITVDGAAISERDIIKVTQAIGTTV